MQKNHTTDPLLHDEELEEKSKSQLKREMQVLFELGEAVCDLSKKHLSTIPMDEDITEVVARVRRMPHREARRRELRFLAKRLREIDTAPIALALQRLEEGSQEQAREFHRLEQLRDLILSDATRGIAEVLKESPHADRQVLNQLARNARKESEHNKPPVSSRKLFKYLRELSAAN